MKKELLLLLQFFTIVLISGFGLFGIVMLVDITVLSIWSAYRDSLLDWIMTFLALSSIRLVLIKLTAKNSIITQNFKDNKSLMMKEVSITAQYLVIAFISIMFSFLIPVLLNTDENVNLNIGQMWLVLRATFLYWFVGFSILSFIRIGIIYIKKVS